MKILISRYKNTTTNGNNKYYISLLDTEGLFEDRLMLITAGYFTFDKRENIIGTKEAIERFLEKNKDIKHIKL